MTEEIAGFQTSPKAQVQAAFEEIARRSMHDLSFLHPSMPVYVSEDVYKRQVYLIAIYCCSF